MRFRDIARLDPDDYAKRLLFGRSKLHANFNAIRNNNFRNVPDPVFFLSTGRCGTRWFAFLLSRDRSVRAFHEPKPNLGVQGKVAYDIYAGNHFQNSENEDQLLQEIFLTAREQFIRYSYKTQRRFIETNNHITFLAPAILKTFPNARFVHLNRHPGEFVRSAIRRKYYDNRDDIKRITPLKGDPHETLWETYGLVEKNAWLWTETNQFIESFRTIHTPKHFFYFDFSDLNALKVRELNDFLKIRMRRSAIEKLLKKPINRQNLKGTASYDQWPENQVQSLKRICGPLAEKYKYTL